jgi:hypothetical protein
VQTIQGSAPTLLANPSFAVDQTPQLKLTVPTPNYDATINNTNANTSAVESANKSYQDFIKQATPQQTDLDRQLQDYLKSFADLTTQDTEKQQYQIQQENLFGTPELKQQISDLNSQILSGLAEQKQQLANYQAANLAIEQQPQQLAGVVGTKQQELMRTYATQQAAKSADLGLLQARQAALGGQLNTALDLAQRATDLKYQPIEDSLKVKQAQINAILPLLNKQEKIQAQALEAFYNQEQERVADEKAKAKSNISSAMEAGITTRFYNYGGEIRNTTDGYAYTSEDDFQQKTGMTLQQARNMGLITDYGTALAKKQAQKGSSTVTERLLSDQQTIVSNAVSQLDNERRTSSDGYANPDTYRQFKQQYIAAGGTPTNFFQSFPLEVYISPSNRKGDLLGTAMEIKQMGQVTEQNELQQLLQKSNNGQNIENLNLQEKMKLLEALGG